MTDWPLIAVRFALYADLGLAFGLPLFGLYALRGAERRSRALVPIALLVVLLGGVGLVLSVFGFALLAASMGGTSIGTIDPAILTMLLSETAIGWAFAARMMGLLIVMLAGLAVARAPTAALAMAACGGAVSLATLAWTGHAAATEGSAGIVHMLADLLHLWAAGLWLGALFALVLMLARTTSDPERLSAVHLALEGFSRTGTLAVGTLLVTGIVNSWVLVGVANIAGLANGLYGQLLLLKLLLFAAMLALAATNRFRLTPALDAAIADGRPGRAMVSLRLSLAVETGAAVAILALVGWLGTLSPPASGG